MTGMPGKIAKTAEETISLHIFLKKELGLTERQIRQAKFRQDGICVNGERCRITTALKLGDLVEVILEENTEQKMVPAKGKLDILYEDEDLLVINKAEGIVVHPSHGHYGDSILNIAAAYYTQKEQNVNLRVVGRLDKETSGVLVLAKNQIAAARLSEQKENGSFQKEYLAVTVGIPNPLSGTIRKDIQKIPGSLNKMMTSSDEILKEEQDIADGDLLKQNAKTAVTHYETIGVFHNASNALSHAGKTTAEETHPLMKIKKCIELEKTNWLIKPEECVELEKPNLLINPKSYGELDKTHPLKNTKESIKAGFPVSLLRIKIETGRTHQIRVHMASIGCPLLGDSLYGESDSQIRRTALHAEKAEFYHPFTREKMQFQAPLPEDIIKILKS